MLDLMLAFASIVDHKSINKASSILNISQPALSRRLNNLEEQLGIELFHRKGKKLELTKMGQISYAYALKLKQLQKEYLEEISNYDRDPHQFTIGASLTTLQSTLPDLISMLSKIEPQADIKAVTGKTHEIVSLVEDHQVDFGLVASSINHTGIQCIPLFADHLALVVPKNHPLLLKQPYQISMLNDLPMILFSNGTWYRILMDELFLKYHISPDVKMEIDSFEAIIRLISTYQAATLLPMSYLHPNLLKHNELELIPLAELKQAIRTTSLIYAIPSKLPSTIVQWFPEAAKQFRENYAAFTQL